MAEAIAALSLISAVTQLIDFGSKIIARLNEAQSSAGELPKSYRDVQTELPLLVDILNRTKGQTKSDQVNDSTQQALVPVIEGCYRQVKVLEEILSKTLPLADDTWPKRGAKAVSGVYQEKRVEQLVTKLHGYIQLLTYHEITKFANLVAFTSDSKSYYEVPARRVPEFIGREDVLSDMDYLYDTASVSRPITLVLRGMGGQGKTQIALEFCRRAHITNRISSIFWVDATSEIRVKKEIEKIFHVITPPHQVFPDTEAKLRHVKARLEGWQTSWLMVFDNYDDLSGFPNVRDYMPSGAKGSLLVTSRHTDSERLGLHVEVPCLQEEDALELLLKRCSLNITAEHTEQGLAVVERLGYHALAIDQAAAYVRKRKMPLSQFVEHYTVRKERVLKEIPKLWEYRRTLNDAESDTAMSVFTTWELAFQQLGSNEEDRMRKGHFLTISAFLNHKCISGDLFKVYHRIGHNDCMRLLARCGDEQHLQQKLDWLQLFTSGGAWSGLDFEETLIELRDLCLVQSFSYEEKSLPSFSLHPLVRDWIRTRASMQERHRCLMQATLMVASFLEAPLGDGEIRPLAYCWHLHLSLPEKQRLFLHMATCVEAIEETPPYGLHLGVRELEDAAERFARLYNGLGQYQDARLLYERLLNSRQERLGPENPLVLKTYSQLAFVCRHLGKYEDAASYYETTLAIQERTLGIADPETLISIANVAVLMWYQGKYEVAERLDRLALARREEILGPDDPATLSSVSNLALTLQYQEKLQEAEVMHRRALERRQRQADTDHARRPDLWTSLGNLALLLTCQGENFETENCLGLARERYKEAEQLCWRALQAKSDHFGESHPETLIISSNMANVIRCLEHLSVLGCETYPRSREELRKVYERSEAAYEDILEKRLNALGKLHPHTLESLESLAMVYRDQLRFEEAAVLRRSALAGYEILRGKSHPDTLGYLERQIEIMDTTTEQGEAKQLLQRLIKEHKGLCGDEDFRTRMATSKLAAMEASAGLQQAERQPQHGVSFRKRCLHRGSRQGYN
ncbi:MAG: hypothetical protein M1835_005792 [Candelina submexicana]|nr:MAG: hypothetical protein M1835_005792 [Candelina submexicana]